MGLLLVVVVWAMMLVVLVQLLLLLLLLGPSGRGAHEQELHHSSRHVHRRYLKKQTGHNLAAHSNVV